MDNIVRFPGWRYGPEGQSEIFESEDQVPEGWTDNPNDHKPKKAAAAPHTDPAKTPPEASAYTDWGKDKLAAELTARKVTFNKNWPEKKLIQLLEANDKKAK